MVPTYKVNTSNSSKNRAKAGSIEAFHNKIHTADRFERLTLRFAKCLEFHSKFSPTFVVSKLSLSPCHDRIVLPIDHLLE